MIRIQGVEGWQDGNYFYNKVRLEDVGGPRGIKKMGTEHVAAIGFFTRGMLIDIAALKGVTRLQKGYAITLADYQAALKAQGITDATQGDVVLLRTGWNSLWKDYTKPPDQQAKDHAEFTSGEPGASPELCDYLAGRKIAMIGSDTWGLEVMDPSQPPPEAFGYCHMNLIVRRGISNFENLDLDVLSQEKVYEFLFTWSPLKLVGSTGSPGNPIAAW